MPMNWNKGAFAPKIERVLTKIDELAEGSNKVSLIGASAGASVVLCALAARPDKIASAVSICGKINHPETISAWTYRRNSAFKEAMTALSEILPTLDLETRARIMSIHPLQDSLVPVVDTLIPGARNTLMPTVGHVLSIIIALTLGAPFIMRFLKQQAAKN